MSPVVRTENVHSIPAVVTGNKLKVVITMNAAPVVVIGLVESVAVRHCELHLITVPPTGRLTDTQDLGPTPTPSAQVASEDMETTCSGATRPTSNAEVIYENI